MADIVSVVIASADFIHNIVTSSLFTDLGSTDVGDYESDAEMLALSIENITYKLYNLDEQQISPVQKRAFEKLREAVLDAEDILDRVETLTNKKKLKEVDDKVTLETNGKEICSSEYASIKSLANKATNILLSGRNKSDEVQNAIKEISRKLDVVEKYVTRFRLHEPTSKGLSRNLSARASGSQVNARKIMGRDEDKMKIINLLLRCSTNKDRIPVVSVVGMGGMGKTTLAQLVYDDQSWQEECQFELRLWVSDSKKLDLRSLLKSILKCISPGDTSLDNLEETLLKDRLVKDIGGKRFLLVLDDVENESRLSWGNLEDLLSKGNMEGSRVLVTTRSRMVAVAMGSSDSTYQLKGLSEEDSLQLFERYAFEGRRDENLVEIGKLIVKKCAGVPLALKVIGSLLYQKDKRKWELVRDCGLANDNQLMPILKISYDDLDPILKQCFSYCALFPRNYRISKEELSGIWMANVRLKTRKGETLYDICDENLELLNSRCFLEVTKREKHEDYEATHYKMHDLMHDLAKEVAGEEMLVPDFDAQADSNMLIIEENVRHLSLLSHDWEDIRAWTLELKGRRLRTFIGAGYAHSDEPLNLDKSASDFPFLRFLDLKGCIIGNLPNSIGELIHLRYLCLADEEEFFHTLDSITELINLQHLVLQNWGQTHLPSEMGALISLEVLHIASCHRLQELPKDIQRLANLKRLVLTYCWGLTHLPSEIGGLTSLELLHIASCDNLMELPKDIQRLANLRRLKLQDCHSLTHLPSEMGGLTSLEVLHVYECGKLKELPKDVQKLTNLKRLKLNFCRGLTHLPSEMGTLTSLEVLDLYYCLELKECPKDVQKLTNLRRLKFAWCKAITHLPFGVAGLASLEVLDFSGCDELKELPMGIENLTNLKKLKLERCTGLTQMPSGMGALLSVCTPHRLIVGHPESKHSAQLEELASVSELKHGELEIQLPYNITSKTPARDGDAYLLNKKSLRKLKIQWKKEDGIEEEEEEEEVPANHKDILTKLQPPPNLEEFFLEGYQGVTFPAWVPKDDFGSILPNLVEIHIESCDRCRHLPALSRLPCLKSMTLRLLRSLEYIEEDVLGTSFFPSLEILVLSKLPELKGWCIGGGGLTTGIIEQEQSLMLPSFPRLLVVEIFYCPNLKVEPILVSFVKVFSVKSGEVEKELSEKREETMSSSGTPPPALSSSSLALCVAICRDNAGFHISMKERDDGHSLGCTIRNWKASDITLRRIMVEAFRDMSKHLTSLSIYHCSELKTLTGLQHLTALQQLGIVNCRNFAGEEDEEEGKQIKSNSLKIGESSSTCLEAQDADNQWKCLQSLQRLHFRILPGMKRLPEGIQFITSLKELIIGDCDNLTLPEWVHNTFRGQDRAWGVEYRRVQRTN